MLCSYPRSIVVNGKQHIYIPCGMCLACRINKTSEWALRLNFELDYYKGKAVFVTLTYDDEHLPDDLSLHKEDLQKFFKRLRKRLSYRDKKIRYYACGEYGDSRAVNYDTGFGRPHYHCIIFGLDSNDKEDREDIADSWQFCSRFFFDEKHKAIGSVTSASIRYVTGYVRKKLKGFEAERYDEVGILPPFQVCSQGLGLLGFEKYRREYGDTDFVDFNGYKYAIPKYFRQKLGIDYSKVLNSMKQSQIDFLLSHGFEMSDIIRLRMNSQDGQDLVEDAYYDLIRNNLEAKEDILKYRLNMKSKGVI